MFVMYERSARVSSRKAGLRSGMGGVLGVDGGGVLGHKCSARCSVLGARCSVLSVALVVLIMGVPAFVDVRAPAGRGRHDHASPSLQVKFGACGQCDPGQQGKHQFPKLTFRESMPDCWTTR